VKCFLCGTDWIFKYYLDELRLQTVGLILSSMNSWQRQISERRFRRIVKIMDSWSLPLYPQRKTQNLRKYQTRSYHCFYLRHWLHSRTLLWQRQMGKLIVGREAKQKQVGCECKACCAKGRDSPWEFCVSGSKLTLHWKESVSLNT
jgi:hypothetical protein